MKNKSLSPISLVRRIARIMSMILLVFFIVMIIAETAGWENAESGQLLSFHRIAFLSLMGISVAGLGLAWKWEMAGSIIVIIAYIALGILDWRALTTPLSLYPLNAMLYMLSWILKLRYPKDRVKGT